jgi:hypothetical protein
MLLSGASPGHQVVSIQVPSAYISQASNTLDVTLDRGTAGGRSLSKGTITVNFSATTGSTTAVGAPEEFTPVDESVIFPAGQASETIAVPINANAPNPGLVAVDLAVTSAVRQVKGSSETIYLASSAAAIPPSIIAVNRVAGGIALTFSKPMDPATVQNIHNYAVKFSPSENINLGTLYGVGLVQTLDNKPKKIPIRRATYNPATNTVLLVASEQLGSKGSYEISSPSSLHAKKARPTDAQPLTDLEGNALDEGGKAGSFSIRIGRGHPYTAVQPVLAPGS